MHLKWCRKKHDSHENSKKRESSPVNPKQNDPKLEPPPSKKTKIMNPKPNINQFHENFRENDFTKKKIIIFLTCRILIVKRIARWGEVFLLHDSSHWLHRNTSIWAYNCMKMMFTNVSIFTMSVNCYTIVIVTSILWYLGVHICHCVVVVFFFSLTNTGFAFDDHFLAIHRAATTIGRILLLRTSSMAIRDFCTCAILGFGKLKFKSLEE